MHSTHVHIVRHSKPSQVRLILAIDVRAAPLGRGEFHLSDAVFNLAVAEQRPARGRIHA